MNNALILMTALVPTVGHASLIEFTSRFPDTEVKVLISGRSFEPVPSQARLAALEQHFAQQANVTVRLSVNDEAPQNPEDHINFWRWWADEINSNFPEVAGDWTYVVASEAYGAQVAESLSAEFIPYDIGRELNSSRGSQVRDDLAAQWNAILPEARKLFQLKATLFGQESVGKTTLSKAAAERLQSDWLFEYARPYMATVRPFVDHHTMSRIHLGQAAIQEIAFNRASTPVVMLDTDLYSTVGYWGIMGEPAPQILLEDARRLKSDVYYMLSDDIPFEPDPLRFGGDERESSMQFWLELLAEEDVTVVRVPSGTIEEKLAFLLSDINKRFHAKNEKVSSFRRE